jgi:hypothetical protein
MPQEQKVETPVSAPSASQPSGSQQTETPTGGQADQTSAKKNEGMSVSELEAVLAKQLAPIVGRLTKVEQRTKSGARVEKPKSDFTFEERESIAPPAKEEIEIANDREFLKVERGITRIIRDSRYQKLLETDSTLAEILENNPLALLKENPIDAEDALTSIISILDDKSSKISVPPVNNQIKTEVPEAGPPNPPSEAVKPTPDQNQPRKLKTPDDVGKGITDRMMGR